MIRSGLISSSICVFFLFIFTSTGFSQMPVMCIQGQHFYTYFSTMQNESQTIISSRLVYENIAVKPPLQPVIFAPLFIYVYNDTWDGKLILTYTNNDGYATINISKHVPEKSCYNVRIIYCNADEITISCLENFGVKKPILDWLKAQAQIEKISTLMFYPISILSFSSDTFDMSLFKNSPSGPLSFFTPKWYRYYTSQMPDTYSHSSTITLSSALDEIQMCGGGATVAPAATVSFCIPLILIFALMAGGLFLSGKNPLMGFDFATPRIGKYYGRYSARGRGWFFDLSSIRTFASGIQSAKSDVVNLKSEGYIGMITRDIKSMFSGLTTSSEKVKDSAKTPGSASSVSQAAVKLGLGTGRRGMALFGLERVAGGGGIVAKGKAVSYISSRWGEYKQEKGKDAIVYGHSHTVSTILGAIIGYFDLPGIINWINVFAGTQKDWKQIFGNLAKPSKSNARETLKKTGPNGEGIQISYEYESINYEYANQTTKNKYKKTFTLQQLHDGKFIITVDEKKITVNTSDQDDVGKAAKELGIEPQRIIEMKTEFEKQRTAAAFVVFEAAHARNMKVGSTISSLASEMAKKIEDRIKEYEESKETATDLNDVIKKIAMLQKEKENYQIIAAYYAGHVDNDRYNDAVKDLYSSKKMSDEIGLQIDIFNITKKEVEYTQRFANTSFIIFNILQQQKQVSSSLNGEISAATDSVSKLGDYILKASNQSKDVYDETFSKKIELAIADANLKTARAEAAGALYYTLPPDTKLEDFQKLKLPELDINVPAEMDKNYFVHKKAEIYKDLTKLYTSVSQYALYIENENVGPRVTPKLADDIANIGNYAVKSAKTISDASLMLETLLIASSADHYLTDYSTINGLIVLYATDKTDNQRNNRIQYMNIYLEVNNNHNAAQRKALGGMMETEDGVNKVMSWLESRSSVPKYKTIVEGIKDGTIIRVRERDMDLNNPAIKSAVADVLVKHLPDQDLDRFLELKIDYKKGFEELFAVQYKAPAESDSDENKQKYEDHLIEIYKKMEDPIVKIVTDNIKVYNDRISIADATEIVKRLQNRGLKQTADKFKTIYLSDKK